MTPLGEGPSLRERGCPPKREAEATGRPRPGPPTLAHNADAWAHLRRMTWAAATAVCARVPAARSLSAAFPLLPHHQHAVPHRESAEAGVMGPVAPREDDRRRKFGPSDRRGSSLRRVSGLFFCCRMPLVQTGWLSARFRSQRASAAEDAVGRRERPPQNKGGGRRKEPQRV